MRQEDKDLLLKDLCVRLPYGVKVEYRNEIFDIEHVSPMYEEVKLDTHETWTVYVSDVKPYLFPLSSITEEQRNDISKLLIDTQNTFSPYGEINTKGCDNLFVCSVKQSNAFINYCLMHHLDINGLIEKGLAIDATGLNIY